MGTENVNQSDSMSKKAQSTEIQPASAHEYAPDSGAAVVPANPARNPGLPPERPRVTDLDPKYEKQAERRISMFFGLSIVGSIFAAVAYVVFPIIPGDMSSVRINNMLVGLGLATALLGVGFGAVHWAKSLMHGHELVEERHPVRGDDETRETAVEMFSQANKESGFTRRSMIRNTLFGALLAAPIPAVVLLRDLAPAKDPIMLLKQTMWEPGTRLARDPSGVPIKASEVTIGSAFHVIPEGLPDLEYHKIEEKAKAAVLLMRLPLEDLNEDPERASWSYEGIVAYSKICTHVGCPVALYEQHTHHLLCPCHQSTFDVKEHCKVIFGPAARALPQLPITVDEEGYLVAQSDFTEPVGPSFWEREL
jgi:ubiquinol-cytochrome c reductase iron-sulfur subunit